MLVERDDGGYRPAAELRDAEMYDDVHDHLEQVAAEYEATTDVEGSSAVVDATGERRAARHRLLQAGALAVAAADHSVDGGIDPEDAGAIAAVVDDVLAGEASATDAANRPCLEACDGTSVCLAFEHGRDVAVEATGERDRTPRSWRETVGRIAGATPDLGGRWDARTGAAVDAERSV